MRILPTARRSSPPSDDHSIKLWDSRDGQLQSTLMGHTELVASVAVSRDGTRLACASFDKTYGSGTCRVVNRALCCVGIPPAYALSRFPRTDGFVASAGDDKTVRIWDAERGEPIHVFEGHTDIVRALAFYPRGTLVVSASNDRTIRGIDLTGARSLFSLPCPEQNSAVAFSPDGSILATGDDRGNLTIWDTATWSRRISVKGSDTAIWGLSFSPDGRTLAAAYGDAKVRLWDPVTGQVMLELDGHTQRVNAVAFAPTAPHLRPPATTGQ